MHTCAKTATAEIQRLRECPNCPDRSKRILDQVRRAEEFRDDRYRAGIARPLSDVSASTGAIGDETTDRRNSCPAPSLVDWEALREEYATSEDFTEAAREVFERHKEVLRRLA